MRNLNKVIESNTFLDNRIFNRTTINCGTGTDFNIIPDVDTAELRNLDPMPFLIGMTESIRSDNCTWMYLHSFTDIHMVT